MTISLSHLLALLVIYRICILGNMCSYDMEREIKFKSSNILA